MSKTVEYYFTPASPWTYLGVERLQEIAAKHGATVEVRPSNYGVIFPETGGKPLHERPQARQDYRIQELKRWSKELDKSINIHPRHFPFKDELAARAIIAADLVGGDALELSKAIGRACWEEERDMADEAEVRKVVEETGLDADAVMEKAKGDETAELRERYTREALDRGVFGAPTYVVGDEVLWGQDRLDFLDKTLAEAA